MIDNKEMTADVDSVIRKYVPKWKVIDKKDSWFHRQIGKMFPTYLKDFSTTIGFTSAYPTSALFDWRTHIHEGQHARQCMKYTRLGMAFLYSLPQLLALIGPLLSLIFWNPWFLLFLLLLLPLPSYFRMKFELEAYKITIMVMEWTFFTDSSVYFQSILSNFTGPAYYVMWPIQKDMILSELTKAKNLARVWDQLPVGSKDPYLEEMFQLIKQQGLLKVK